MFDLVNIPGKGKGLVSTADIPAGQLIISEPPILRLLTVDGKLSPKASVDLERQYSSLPDHRRKLVNDLANNYSMEQTHIMGVFKTNAMIISNDESCLFPLICRANHACVPNCTYVWDAKSENQRMYACRRIVKGEELCVSYLPDSMVETRTNRQAYLKDYYGFDCACEICSLGKGFVLSQDEEDRKKAIQLVGLLNSTAKRIEPSLGQDNYKKLYEDVGVQLYDHLKTMIIHPTFEYLILNSLFSVSVLLLHQEKAQHYAEEACRLSQILSGLDSTSTLDWVHTKETLRDQFNDLGALEEIVAGWSLAV